MRATSVAAYGVKWESKNNDDVWKSVGKTGLLIGGNIAMAYGTGGTMTILRTLVLGHKSVNVFHDLFDSTKKMAKFSG